jgi:hypothetical protein
MWEILLWECFLHNRKGTGGNWNDEPNFRFFITGTDTLESSDYQTDGIISR